jgi:acyl carrier protein
MLTANEILEFISSVNPRFTSDSNLTADKLEYIALVLEVEERYGVTLPDEVLNGITNVSNLIDEVLKVVD